METWFVSSYCLGLGPLYHSGKAYGLTGYGAMQLSQYIGCNMAFYSGLASPSDCWCVVSYSLPISKIIPYLLAPLLRSLSEHLMAFSITVFLNRLQAIIGKMLLM
jgi:hypothetical protein